MANLPDIDIDFADRETALKHFKHIRASRIENNIRVKHNTGVYMSEVPFDPMTNLSSVDYKEAEEQGYFKLDFLNVSIYKDVRDEAHLQELIEREPLWELLEHEDFSEKVFHLNGHSNLLKLLKPTSVEQLAATLAIIRPAKRHLAGVPWEMIMTEVWTKPTDGAYYFKKSHAISYAVAVVVHMNLLCEQITS
jgi:DNA polymerase III alpha subunit